MCADRTLRTYLAHYRCGRAGNTSPSRSILTGAFYHSRFSTDIGRPVSLRIFAPTFSRSASVRNRALLSPRPRSRCNASCRRLVPGDRHLSSPFPEQTDNLATVTPSSRHIDTSTRAAKFNQHRAPSRSISRQFQRVSRRSDFIYRRVNRYTRKDVTDVRYAHTHI